MTPFYIASHLSVSKGFAAAAKDAVSIGANTFQFFTRNPRGSRAKALDEKDIAACAALMNEHTFGPLLAHAPYSLNAASKDEQTREFARMTM